MSFLRRFRKSTKGKVVILGTFMALFLMLDFGVLYGITKNRESLGTTEADALYGGTSDLTSYASAGYLLDYSSLFSQQVCGITFMSDRIAISAAHCFKPDGLYYAGTGVIKTGPTENFPVSKYQLDGRWDEASLRGDIAVLTLEEPVQGVSEYAQIAVPRPGCNYEVLAYGSTDEYVLSNEDLRRKATVCIESIGDEHIYIKSPDGGVCFGDSGSPIFVKNSNKIVGIISAITADQEKYSKDNCFISNTAVATRLDASAPFINSAGLPLTEGVECPLYSGNVCAVNQVCRSNQCRGASDYSYISALDYRSANYVLSGYFSIALLAIFVGITILFLFLIIRSANRVGRF